jgi:hypothetical protein
VDFGGSVRVFHVHTAHVEYQIFQIPGNNRPSAARRIHASALQRPYCTLPLASTAQTRSIFVPRMP